MAILVSCNPGTGKSTLTAELVRRGFTAVDADEVDGLAAWMDSTGAVIGDATLPVTSDLLANHYWGWSARPLLQLVGELGPDGLLLGIAVNQWEFISHFQALVLLELDAETYRERVITRHELVQKHIHVGLPLLQAQTIERGAFRIDEAQPTSAIADQIVKILADLDG